jgi:hypothetical protein
LPTATIDNVLALDVNRPPLEELWPSPERIESFRRGNPEIFRGAKSPPAVRRVLANQKTFAHALRPHYARNYLRGLLQKMDLRDTRGTRRRFDEIVSGFTLIYVMADTSLADRVALLARALEHLKPGGFLRAWAYKEQKHREEAEQALKILEQRGLVSHYAFADECLVVQRSTDPP